MNQKRFKAFSPLVIFFVLLNGILLTAGKLLDRWEVDRNVVIIGNVVLFIITLISYLMAVNGLRSTNPHAFVRSVYSSILLKLFLCVIAAFVYISIAGKELNKPALFTCMGLYLVYTFVEVSILMKLLKEKTT